MDELFSNDIQDLQRLGLMGDEEKELLEKVDLAAEELGISEYEHYLKHEFNEKAIEIAKKHGLFAINAGKEFGGKESGFLVHALAQQRLGQNGLGFSTMYDVQTFISLPSVERWGNAEQKSRYLEKMASGNYIFSFGLTEPDAGSDPGAMKTNYEKDGDSYILNGEKYLITNGSICDYIILFAKSRTGNDMTAFLVDSESEGFGIEMQLREKIGLFTSDTSMIKLEDVKVPESEVLGGEGKGLHVAYSALLNGRIGIGSACVGVIEGSLKASVSRARERIQHGKEIGKHQLIQQHIAAIRQNLEMARWPVYDAAVVTEEYKKDYGNKAALKSADIKSALAKRIASRLAFESADRAVQVHGGFGYSLLSPVGQLFCDSRVARIYEGTDEIQDLKIAVDLLGKGYEAY